MRFSSLSHKFLLGVAGLAVGGAALAQQTAPAPAPPGQRSPLNLPTDNSAFLNADPAIRKATAIVNGHVITQTDIDQRLALVVANAGGRVPAEEAARLRLQVFSNLIDETLQIQEAAGNEITVTQAEIDRAFSRYAENNKQSAQEFAGVLKRIGSSEASVKRQIQGEYAWRRLQQRKVESFISVGDDEVQAVLDRLTAAKGATEYKISEIYLAAPPGRQSEVLTAANKIIEGIGRGTPFAAYARQFSEASTAAVGGDLGWVRPEQLPDPLAQAARRLPVGQISAPIEVPGGYSVIAVTDTRGVLTADTRDAELNLKQISIGFAPGTTQAQATPLVEQFARASQSIGGCGKAEAFAATMKAEVVQSDSLKVRDLPPALQEIMTKLQVGEATRPFGSVEDGVRVLVLCGRDMPEASQGPTFDQVYAQLNDARVNRRSRRYLRDLRRDAVVDYR